MGASASGVAAFSGGWLLRARTASAQSSAQTSSTAASSGLWTYHSTDVVAPRLTMTTGGTTTGGAMADGYTFVDLQGGSHPCAMILDHTGEPVWIKPTSSNILDLRVQQLGDDQVITYYEGTTTNGVGSGSYRVLDNSYRTVRSISSLDGNPVDLHEGQFTGQGTVLLLSQVVRQGDLSSVNGPTNGWFFDGQVYEVGLSTGAATLRWRASDHIAMTESYLKAPDDAAKNGTSAAKPYDPYHVNSIQLHGDSLLISARHTHALYSVDRTSGELHWRMGGRKSDFTVDPAMAFAWQHHARWRSDTSMSLFDNHADTNTGGPSRGLVFDVDETRRTTTLRHRYQLGVTGGAEGGTELLSNGNVLVSYGTAKRVTEFTSAGSPLMNLTGFPVASYRAYRTAWTGRPTTRPAVAAHSTASGLVVYASWNGATEVRSWRVLAGSSSGTLRRATVAERTGFETAISLPDARYVSVEALADDGRVLGASVAVEAS